MVLYISYFTKNSCLYKDYNIKLKKTKRGGWDETVLPPVAPSAVSVRGSDIPVEMNQDDLRLHLEVIYAIKEAVGTDSPVAIRFGGCDHSDGGSRIADIPQAVKAFKEAGTDLIGIGRALNIGAQRAALKTLCRLVNLFT